MARNGPSLLSTLGRKALASDLGALLDLCRSHGELRLESFEGNAPANAFYLGHGWLEAGRQSDEASGASKILFTKSAP